MHGTIWRRKNAVLGAAALALALAVTGAAVAAALGTAAAPKRGGTLKLVGQGDVDHLDTSSIYSGVTYTIERAYTRQLVTYPATGTTSMPTNLVPDIATTVPTVANHGVTNGGRTYTYHLKRGVTWDTTPARQVTAADEVRGIEMLCNPASPTGAPGYYESTIVGMTAWCKSFLKAKPTVAAIRAFLGGHHLAGVQAKGPLTVVFHLTRPASDFNNIVSLPFASPQPVEVLSWVPDSADYRAHTIADGPYRISTYKPNNQIVLTRNPAWKAATDHVRKAYVDEIDISEGQTSQAVQQQLQAGTADMEWDSNVPPQSLPSLHARHDPNLDIYQSGSLDPYMVINFRSPNANRATSKLAVRQAVEYAVDKAGVVQVNGGPLINKPLGQVITPGSAGYKPFDLYRTAGSRGNPKQAKRLLARAGYGGGVTLTLLYDDADPDPQIAQVIQSSLGKAGIKVKLKQVPQSDLYGKILVTPSQASSGVWDLAVVDWGPDWFGNNGRTTIQPLLDGSTYGPGSSDYGDYNSPAVTKLIGKALAATNSAAANAAWAAADRQAMRDAAIVPIEVHEHASYHASRVQNWRIDPFSRVGDVTAVWLSH